MLAEKNITEESRTRGEVYVSALPRAARGFTLVELLLVMGVIIILVAMLFPVVIGMKDKARKKQALTDAHAIVLALKGYRMEYDRWPNQEVQRVNDPTYFTNNHWVIMPLLGNNARGKVFLTIQATNQVDSVTNFTDPWGVPYVICLDENMNGDCLIDLTNVVYNNNFVSPPTAYSYSAISNLVVNKDVAVASFAGNTNANQKSFTTYGVETWSDPQ
ncbi:MAG: type II secretion system protein [Kiritimatiellia bacterium]|nr:type II secretion system protein [Kiritimatiellia bacterium]